MWIAERAVNAASFTIIISIGFVWCLTCFATNTAHSIHPFVYQNNKNYCLYFAFFYIKLVMQGHVHLRAVSLDSS